VANCQLVAEICYTNGYQGVAGRGGYVACALRRVATPGATTSGRGARSRFPLVST